ncbi:hypothetical protein HDU97_005858 [Phlyctochytrium planicorne]|nr:hypothetical protein HDU97_005858 [Phlyctochytrium planicorne]
MQSAKDQRLAEFVVLVISRIWCCSSSSSTVDACPSSSHHNSPSISLSSQLHAGCPPSPPPEESLHRGRQLKTEANRNRLLNHVRRLLRSSAITTQTIVLALLFIARLRDLNSKDPIREGAECDLFSTALLLAQKVLDDDRVDNVAWVEYAGVPLQTMNGMEKEFLAKIRWQMFVSQAEYHEFIRKLKVIAEELPGGGSRTQAPAPIPPRNPVTPPPDMEMYESSDCRNDDIEQQYVKTSYHQGWKMSTGAVISPPQDTYGRLRIQTRC